MDGRDITRPHGEAVTIDYLLAQARDLAGLTDFGDPWFIDPLTHLLGFANTEAKLTTTDEMRTGILIGFLADRLKMVDHLKRHPEIHDEKLTVAGVIIGHGRGGSTMLQRLVAQSPQLTSTYHWELMSPIPLPGETPGDSSAREALGRAAVKHFQDTVPELVEMHPINAMGFEEELYFLDRCFTSVMYTNYFYVPSYSRWLVEYDQTRSYAELATWLKILQHQRPARRNQKWFLKTGHHLLGGALNPLIKTFPEAKIIMSHRRIEEIVPSVSSISARTMRGYGNTFDDKDIGAQYIKVYRDALDHLKEVRKVHDHRFIDIYYKDTMADPIKQFRNVMEKMGLVVGERDLEAARTWMAQNGRDTHPRHRYTFEQYGVTRDEIAAIFKDYHDTYFI